MLFHPRGQVDIHLPSGSNDDEKALAGIFEDLTRLPSFAHHPACKYWHNHLIYVRGHPCCLGCLCMYSGMLMALVPFYLLLNGLAPPWLLFAIGFVAYTPTVFQIWYQRYSFKIASRFSLGFGIVFMLGAALFGYPWASAWCLANIAMLGAFLALYRATTQVRSRHLDVPCDRCPEGRFPMCSWRHEQIQGLVRRSETGEMPLPPAMADFFNVLDQHLTALAEGASSERVEFETARESNGAESVAEES